MQHSWRQGTSGSVNIDPEFLHLELNFWFKAAKNGVVFLNGTPDL